MFSDLPILSIWPLSDSLQKQRREFHFRHIKKRVDSKVKMVALQQMNCVMGRLGALFPSAAAPRVVMHLLFFVNRSKKIQKDRVKFLHVDQTPRIPIGLKRCTAYPWMNSLIQFFLFLPGSWALFSLLPRSLQFLREFTDHYFADMEERLSVSSADSAKFARHLSNRLAPGFLQNGPTLYEILRAMMKILFPECPFAISEEIHPVVLHPDWHIVFDTIEMDRLQNKMNENIPEILIGCKGSSLKSNYFISSADISYDLDAFIELRPDGENDEHFIAYLKCGGVWYQCDEERIAQFPTNCLNVALRQAALLHYKRVKYL
ncbi:MAG TPA: hypothetical protein VLE95_01430 [Chlamydiales bacterium]|nr:hypothetical protein [Chlamydiales bacterium]